MAAPPSPSHIQSGDNDLTQDQPQLEHVVHEQHVATYIVRHASAVYMNRLRRALLTRVPCLAVDTATVDHTATSFHQQALADRLMAMPVHCDNAKVNLVTASLDVTAPADATEPVRVTSKDIRVDAPDVSIVHFVSPEVRAACEDADGGILVCPLAPGQHVHAELTLSRGTKAERGHERWNPVVAVAARPLILGVEVHEHALVDASDDVMTMLLDTLPPHTLLITRDPVRCELAPDVDMDGAPWDTVKHTFLAAGIDDEDVLHVHTEPNAWKLRLETTGAVNATDAVQYAWRLVQSDVSSYVE